MKRWLGIVALFALSGLALLPPAAGADFGFRPGAEGFSAAVVADGGEAAAVAGSHHYQLSLAIGLNRVQESEQPGVELPDGDLRNLRLEVPTGLIVNPSVVPACTRAQFSTPRSSPFALSQSGEDCPGDTQVGTVRVQTSDGERTFGLFNLKASPGVVAQFGFAPFGSPIVLDVELAAQGNGAYALVLSAENMPQSLALLGFEMNLWGTPWAASHNGERGDCLNEEEPTFPWAKCSVGEPATYRPAALLSLPPQCSGSLPFTALATSWQQAAVATAGAVNRTAGGQPAQMHCDFLQFNPEASGLLDNTRASSASGFVFRLDVDHTRLTDPSYTNPSPPKTAVVKLPDGTTLNPSVGAGLGACAPSQYAAETALNGQGAGCPNDSKIGTLRVSTPLFDQVLNGSVYLARPDDPGTPAAGSENPFDSLIAIYLVAKAPQRGVLVKLAGKLVPSPADGTLTATFDDLPQIPYAALEIAFRSGQRSFLITPPRCGYVPTEMQILPWGAGQPYEALNYTLLKTGIGGGPCPSGTPPFDPAVSSGGVNSNVNAYTPYFVRISRQDDEQEVTSYSLVLPKGVTGKLAGVARCSDAAIAAARAKRGFAEAASPSCPAASQVGRTLTGYGVGSALTYTEGKVYLAGPYKGAPLSLVTVNPATIGPFDLGTIVIQSAFQIDPRTAQLRIDSSASDPIPHILDGVVLHLRDIRVYIDRPEFTHNPSSCEPSRLESRITGSGASFAGRGDDSVATPSNHFQLLNCRILGFQP
ncbi:MAG TPA: hypothetical protein VFZ19_06720, partial [Solirubrobacterales bacterium]